MSDYFQDYEPEARRRIESELAILDNAMDRLDHLAQSQEERIQNRKYILSCILESYSTWSKTGDCLPKHVKLGRFGNKWIQTSITGEDNE